MKTLTEDCESQSNSLFNLEQKSVVILSSDSEEADGMDESEICVLPLPIKEVSIFTLTDDSDYDDDKVQGLPLHKKSNLVDILSGKSSSESCVTAERSSSSHCSELVNCVATACEELCEPTVSNDATTCHNFNARKRKIKMADDSTSSEDDQFVSFSSTTHLTMNVNKELNGFINEPEEFVNSVDDTNFVEILAKTPKRSCLDYAHRGSHEHFHNRSTSCKKWTQGMQMFYEFDVIDDFTISEVMRKQTNFKRDWAINAADSPIQFRPRKRRYFGDRCAKCRQYDHAESDCAKQLCCILCSSTSHLYRKNCPDNRCFACGDPFHYDCFKCSPNTVCQLCGFAGHVCELCPDLWRRFHVTTSGNQVMMPAESFAATTKHRYCYVCAGAGHFGFECTRLPHNVKYRPTMPFVFSYHPPIVPCLGSWRINLDVSPIKPDVQFPGAFSLDDANVVEGNVPSVDICKIGDVDTCKKEVIDVPDSDAPLLHDIGTQLIQELDASHLKIDNIRKLSDVAQELGLYQFPNCVLEMYTKCNARVGGLCNLLTSLLSSPSLVGMTKLSSFSPVELKSIQRYYIAVDAVFIKQNLRPVRSSKKVLSELGNLKSMRRKFLLLAMAGCRLKERLQMQSFVGHLRSLDQTNLDSAGTLDEIQRHLLVMLDPPVDAIVSLPLVKSFLNGTITLRHFCKRRKHSAQQETVLFPTNERTEVRNAFRNALRAKRKRLRKKRQNLMRQKFGY